MFSLSDFDDASLPSPLVTPRFVEYIIGIDPGTHCGWCVLNLETGERIASGVWDLSVRRHEGGGMRYLRARQMLRQLIDASPPVALLYEEVAAHKGSDAAHVYGGIVGQVTSLCEERGIPYKGMPVGTVKKYASGKGNCGKPEMIAAAIERWHFDVADDNEADALWVAETWRSQQ